MSQTPLSDELARISREEFERYLEDFRPTEQATIKSLNTSTVGKAMDSSAADAVRSRASLERMRERYGTTATPDQAAGEARQNALSGTLSTLNAGNVAAQNDSDNRQKTLAGLLNVGQGIRQQALGNFGSASSLEGQRASANTSNQVAYKQQQAAQKQQTTQSAVALAAMAAMYFM